MFKSIIVLAFFFLGSLSISVKAQSSLTFWSSLTELCGKGFEGEILAAPEGDSFRNQRLVMHVSSCTPTEIKIPFYVGEDSSRTWVFSLIEDRIQLKHDHRHQDGSEDEVTQYGGLSSNAGTATVQMFPADPFTAELIPAAATNLWWVELQSGDVFTYNLRRLGTDRYFSIGFNLRQEIQVDGYPWGWEQ